MSGPQPTDDDDGEVQTRASIHALSIAARKHPERLAIALEIARDLGAVLDEIQDEKP